MHSTSLLGVSFARAAHCFDVIAPALVGVTGPTAATRAITVAHSGTNHRRGSRRLIRCGMRPIPSESLTPSRGGNRGALPHESKATVALGGGRRDRTASLPWAAGRV